MLYHISSDVDGCSVVAAQDVESGAKAKKTADPTKEGYTFKGWKNGTANFDFTAEIKSDITLKAVWEEDVPVIEKFAKVRVPGTKYSGRLSYEMIENTGYDDAYGKEIKCKIGVTDLTLAKNDTIKITFVIADSADKKRTDSQILEESVL